VLPQKPTHSRMFFSE